MKTDGLDRRYSFFKIRLLKQMNEAIAKNFGIETLLNIYCLLCMVYKILKKCVVSSSRIEEKKTSTWAKSES